MALRFRPLCIEVSTHPTRDDRKEKVGSFSVGVISCVVRVARIAAKGWGRSSIPSTGRKAQFSGELSQAIFAPQVAPPVERPSLKGTMYVIIHKVGSFSVGVTFR